MHVVTILNVCRARWDLGVCANPPSLYTSLATCTRRATLRWLLAGRDRAERGEDGDGTGEGQPQDRRSHHAQPHRHVRRPPPEEQGTARCPHTDDVTLVTSFSSLYGCFIKLQYSSSSVLHINRLGNETGESLEFDQTRHILSNSLYFVFTELPLPGSAECALRLWRHRYTWQPEVHHRNVAHEWQGRYLKYLPVQYPAHNVGVALHVLVSLTLLCIHFKCFTCSC